MVVLHKCSRAFRVCSARHLIADYGHEAPSLFKHDKKWELSRTGQCWCQLGFREKLDMRVDIQPIMASNMQYKMMIVRQVSDALSKNQVLWIIRKRLSGLSGKVDQLVAAQFVWKYIESPRRHITLEVLAHSLSKVVSNTWTVHKNRQNSLLVSFE